MEVQWFSKNFKGIVSLYETNITLNTVAAANFEDAYAVLIGYNKANNTLVIKHLNKEEATSGTYGKCELHPVSIKPSYGRINGKDIIRNISRFYPLDFTQKSMYKFESVWDDSTKSLVICLKGETN